MITALETGVTISKEYFDKIATFYIVEEDAYTADGVILRHKDEGEEVYVELTHNADGSYTVTYID